MKVFTAAAGVPFTVLALAALLALPIRRMALRGARGAALGWARWLFAGLWLGWIEAVDLDRVAVLVTRPGFLPPPLAVLAGVALYAAPPAVATLACARILAPAAAPARHILPRLAGPVAAAPRLAAVLATLALGYRFAESAPWLWILTMIAAALAVTTDRRLRGTPTTPARTLSSGDLHARAMEMARRMGVRLGSVRLAPSPGPGMEDTTALPGNGIAITQRLAAELAPRELDAVLALELAHLRARHPAIDTAVAAVLGIAGLAYALALLAGLRGDTFWGRSLPAALLLALAGFAALTRRLEYAADACSVAVTADPEALIAALGHAARINASPLDWGPLAGALLWVPPSRRRALRIGRRAGLAETRVEALLREENPLG